MKRNSNQKRRGRGTLPYTVELLEVRTLLSGTGSVSEPASIDGTGNNLDTPEWGSAHIELLRLADAAYADGLSAPAGANRPSARAISNVVADDVDGSILNARGNTDILWLWGQFIDHDIDITEGATPAEPFNIPVPQGDPFFDPFGTGTQVIPLNRSIFEVDHAGVRQQINEITAFLDGSVVYGSDDIRALALRELSGGRLKTSAGDLLPFNTAGLPNAGGPSASLFVAGDVRANENAALSATGLPMKSQRAIPA